MNRLKIVFFCSVIIALFFFFGTILAVEADKKVTHGAYEGYNVILVSFDALQASHVGCLGYFRKTTSTIDKFAKEGFLFKNAIAQSSWTVPSTMSYFTSLYPSQHRIVNKFSTYTENEKVFSSLNKLSPEVVTLAAVMKENGYVTGGFTGDAGVGSIFGFGQGFDEYFEGPKFGGMERSIPEAIEWLKQNHAKKFFLFLHGYDAHGQYDPPGGYANVFVEPPYRGPLKGGKDEQADIRERGLENGQVNLTEEDVRFWRALYDEKIKDVDARFAHFVGELGKMGLLDKTIIVLFSDHGTEFYEHKRFDHGFSLYDELIHVLLVFWLPHTQGGIEVEDQVRSIDVMPTVLDLIGVKASAKVKAQMQGVSFVSLMNGRHIALPAFSETDYRFYACKRSIRTPDGFKFIYSLDSGKRELYDLKKDPGELNNLADTERIMAYELEQKLFSWLKSTGQDESYYRKLFKSVLKIKEF